MEDTSPVSFPGPAGEAEPGFVVPCSGLCSPGASPGSV